MSFQISPLARRLFEPLFALNDAELAAKGAVRQVADAHPGYPCRVSLTDAEVGEMVILVHFEHHSAATPFRASHAVYVRPTASEAVLAAGEVPLSLRSRLLSVRAFDARGMMIKADVVEGGALEPLIADMFDDPRAAYLHVHFASPGCYAARVDRAGPLV